MKPSGAQNIFPSLGYGLGLRAPHYGDVLSGRPRASWFEVTTENYMEAGGRPLAVLEQIRARHPVVFHGVSLSLGGTDPLSRPYLARLKELVERFEPAMVSDHCCWTGVDGENLHDLLPLPYTREAAAHVADRVGRVQDFLKRPILVENVSSYLSFNHDEMTEWEFLTALSERSGCGLLLDVNNIYVSAVNHRFDPRLFLRGVPAHRVAQMHLAGHSTETTDDGRTYLIDTHDHPVCDAVWDLYAEASQRFPHASVMVEWDANLPPYERLEEEMLKAKSLAEQAAHGNRPRRPDRRPAKGRPRPEARP